MPLQRRLSLLAVFCIASGAMISSGLFVLPGLAYAKAGPSIIVCYLLAGLLSLPGMLSIAEMSTALPKAGADCYTVIRSMGPGLGTVAGVLSWFALAMKSAFALAGMAIFVAALLPLDIHVIAGVACLLFVGVNLLGIKEAGVIQVALVLGLFALMLLYVIAGSPKVSLTRFEPFAPGGAVAVFSVSGYVFISYAGLLKVASVAEEIQNPTRNIPLGMLVSLLIVTVFYVLMVGVTIGVLEPTQLGNSLTPISDGAAVFLGRNGRIALSVAAILAFLTTANAGIMTAARSLVPLSRDRLFPELFGKIHARRGTPQNALLLTGAFIILSLFLKLDVLVETASIVLILTNLFSCAAVIILRESRLQNYRPSFRAPLYPWLQIAGILGFAFILLEMGLPALLMTSLLIVASSCLYWFYGRRRVTLEFAFLHLIERLTDRRLVTGSLEAELLEVIRQRDEIAEDRFDSLVETCPVLDLDGPSTPEDFFRLVAAKLSDRTKTDAPVLAASLLARENESSTVLSPELAIPHVVIEGEKIFDIVLARSRQGIRFSDQASTVHAVFVLVGTRDERNFHLRALAAVAQIARDPQFMRRWMAARNERSLRDIVLLGERTRTATP
ncbi:MAG: amino acid permease [Planctomycetota bacterium]